MLNIKNIILFLSLFLIHNTSYSKDIIDRDKYIDVENSIKMEDLILKGAAQDIASNISL